MKSKYPQPSERRKRSAVLAPHILIPCLLATITLGLAAWSSWSSLRPAKHVTVTQILSIDTPPVDLKAASWRGPTKPTITVQAPGWIEPDPYPTAAVALADGVIRDVLVLEGESVRAGEAVAILVPDDAEISVSAARSELRLAEAEMRTSEARLAAAETDWNHPIELTRAVQSANAAVEELEAKLQQLPAHVREARATLVAKAQEAERVAKAADSGSASEIEVIIAEAAKEAQAAIVESLDRQKAILNSQLDMARAELVAATGNAELRVQDRLALASAEASLAAAQARVDRIRTTVAEAELRLTRMTVVAPIDGYILRRLKSPGDKVMLGMDNPSSSHVVEIYDPARLQVRADVPLAEASFISIGQQCEVFCEVLPDRAFQGQVTRITNLADLQRNTLEVKVQLLDPDPILKPEMLTRVRFLSGSNDEPTVGENQSARLFSIPRSAIGDAGQVLVVRNRRGLRGTVEAIDIQSVRDVDEDESLTVVSGSLRATDLVILDQSNVRQGEIVQMAVAGGKK